MRLHGIPQEFLDHAKRGVILERIGLTAQTLARSIVEDVTALDAGESLLHASELDPGLFEWAAWTTTSSACAPASPPWATGPPTSTGPGGSQVPRAGRRRDRARR